MQYKKKLKIFNFSILLVEFLCYLEILRISKIQIIVRLKKISNVRKNNQRDQREKRSDTINVSRTEASMEWESQVNVYIELCFIYIPSTRSLCVKRVYMRDFLQQSNKYFRNNNCIIYSHIILIATCMYVCIVCRSISNRSMCIVDEEEV